MIEYMVKKLLGGITKPDNSNQLTIRIATLSRGYGRQSTGFRLAGSADTAHTIGDEPLQLYRKFGQQVVVAVAERRAEGLQQLSGQFPGCDVVLLDDAFQHRAVQPNLNVLLTDYNRPFYHDHPFPEGRLRERRQGAKRAHVIVVTKCPDDLSDAEKQLIIDAITPYKVTQTPVFFSGLTYDVPKPFGNQLVIPNKKTPVILVSGLANADPLDAYVRRSFSVIKHYRYNDHHDYSRVELDTMLGYVRDGAILLTTEKDWVKLDSLLTEDERTTLPLFYLPVAVRFLAEEDAFLQLIRQAISHKNS